MFGDLILHKNHYQIFKLDRDREIQYNRGSVRILPNGTADVDATLHRPLRCGGPWNFGFNGVCPEAYAETDNYCVPHQLHALLGKRGLSEGSIERRLDSAYHRLYTLADPTQPSPESPYVVEDEDGVQTLHGWREAGVTCAMLLEFGKQLNIAVHVMWHKAKISSFVPESAKHSLALYVHGTHAFFVGDPKTKEIIAKNGRTQAPRQARRRTEPGAQREGRCTTSR